MITSSVYCLVILRNELESAIGVILCCFLHFGIENGRPQSFCSLVIGLGELTCVEITDLFSVPPGLLTVLSAGDFLVIRVHTLFCSLPGALHIGLLGDIDNITLVGCSIFPFPRTYFLYFSNQCQIFDRCFPKWPFIAYLE